MISLILAAQLVTSQPSVDCSLLTPQQAQGLPCAARPVAPPPTPADDCNPSLINPYADPDRAARCAKLPLPAPAEPLFLVGHVYAYGYMSVRAVILGLTRDLDGVQVITYRWVDGVQDGISTQRTPQTPGGRTDPWIYIGPWQP